MRTPPEAQYRRPVIAAETGVIRSFDNRKISRVAKLAGAPDAKAAGIAMDVRLGDRVEAGQPLYTIHAETTGELVYALEYTTANDDIVGLEEI